MTLAILSEHPAIASSHGPSPSYIEIEAFEL